MTCDCLAPRPLKTQNMSTLPSTWKLLKSCLVQDTLQYHIYVRRKFHSSVACYKFTTYCTQIHKHPYSEGARHDLSYCIYIPTKFALLSASLNDKLYSRHFLSCFFNSWVRGLQQAKTMRQREVNGYSATKKFFFDFQEKTMLIATFVRFCCQVPSQDNQLQSTHSNVYNKHQIQCRLKTYGQSFKIVFFRFNTSPPRPPKNVKFSHSSHAFFMPCPMTRFLILIVFIVFDAEYVTAVGSLLCQFHQLSVASSQRQYIYIVGRKLSVQIGA